MDNPARTKLLSRVFLMGLALLLGWGVFEIMRPFLQPVAAAVILTIALYPAYETIHRRIRNRSLAALVSLVLVLVLLLAPVTLLTVQVVHEIQSLYAATAQNSRDEGGWISYLSSFTDGPVNWLATKSGFAAPDLKAMMLSRLENISSSLLGWVSSLAANLGSTLGSLALTLFVMFFLFQGGETFRKRVEEYIPMEPHRVDHLFVALRNAIVANIYGMVAVGVAQGILVGMGFAFMGLRSPVLWGLMAGFASLIPLVGAALVWVPGAVVLVLSGSWVKGLLLVAWGIAAVSSADNIIRPLVLQRGVQLSTLAIFLALMGGVQVFGFIGLFAGPVIFTAAQVVLKILHEELREWEGRPVDAPVLDAAEPSAGPPEGTPA